MCFRGTRHRYYKYLINDIFLDIDWSKSLEADKSNVNNLFKIFFDKINEILDRYAPLKKVTDKQFKQRLKPWVTDKILDKIALKNSFLKCSILLKVYILAGCPSYGLVHPRQA